MQEREKRRRGQEVERRCEERRKAKNEGRQGRKMKRRLGMWKEYERQTVG